jgi:pSer/pThr/pTyr-binding forkhead associated (FHA) protein
MDVSLVLFKKDGSQKTFSLPSAITVIGRRHDCDLCIPLMVVSRRHCQLNYNNEALKIRDLGSRAGTFLNGKPIDETTVRAGDYITIGPLTFLLQIDGEPKGIVPPEQATKRPAAQETPTLKPAPADESFPELEVDESFAELEPDESDSFLDDLEDI